MSRIKELIDGIKTANEAAEIVKLNMVDYLVGLDIKSTNELDELIERLHQFKELKDKTQEAIDGICEVLRKAGDLNEN